LCDMVRENSVNVSGVLDHILEISWRIWTKLTEHELEVGFKRNC
jgi:hypothetical protein